MGFALNVWHPSPLCNQSHIQLKARLSYLPRRSLLNRRLHNIETSQQCVCCVSGWAALQCIQSRRGRGRSSCCCCCNVSNFHVRIPFRETIKRAAQQFSISMDDAGADKLTRNFAGSLQEGGATPTPAPIPLQRLQGLSKDAHELTRSLTPGCQPQPLRRVTRKVCACVGNFGNVIQVDALSHFCFWFWVSMSAFISLAHAKCPVGYQITKTFKCPFG